MKTPGPSKASSAAVFQFTVLRPGWWRSHRVYGLLSNGAARDLSRWASKDRF